MNISKIIGNVNGEYWIEENIIREALFKYLNPVPVPYVVLETVRKQMMLSSIAELLLCRMLDDYLLKDFGLIKHTSDCFTPRRSNFIIVYHPQHGISH